MGIPVTRLGLTASVIGTGLGVGFIIKDRLGGKKYTYQTKEARNKVIIITGATSGIGKATAKELALRKATLVLACRDEELCETVRSSLMFFSKNKRLECMKLDLSSQKSIKEFAENFNKKYKHLHVLINNAGVFGLPQSYTKDNIEMHLGVNHMGHFLLTHLLLPKLKESAPSRIINVTSKCYKKGVIDKENLNGVKEYNADKAYNLSKLANVIFTKELSDQLKGTGVTVNAVYPGVVNTKLMRNTSFYKSWISSITLKPILWMFIKNAQHGSQPIVYAAIDPDITDLSGGMFNDKFEREELALPEGVDKSTCKWLWNVSAKWTNLNNFV